MSTVIQYRVLDNDSFPTIVKPWPCVKVFRDDVVSWKEPDSRLPVENGKGIFVWAHRNRPMNSVFIPDSSDSRPTCCGEAQGKEG